MGSASQAPTWASCCGAPGAASCAATDSDSPPSADLAEGGAAAPCRTASLRAFRVRRAASRDARRAESPNWWLLMQCLRRLCAVMTSGQRLSLRAGSTVAIACDQQAQPKGPVLGISIKGKLACKHCERPCSNWRQPDSVSDLLGQI
jgi:hypothetical protein